MAKFNIAFKLDAVHIDCYLAMSFSLSERSLKLWFPSIIPMASLGHFSELESSSRLLCGVILKDGTVPLIACSKVASVFQFCSGVHYFPLSSLTFVSLHYYNFFVYIAVFARTNER